LKVPFTLLDARLVGVVGFLSLYLVAAVRQFSSWHPLSLMGLCLVGVMVSWRGGVVKGAAATMHIVSVHELMWWVPFVLLNPWVLVVTFADPTQPVVWWVMMPVLTIMFLRRSIPARGFLLCWMLFAGYLLAWVWIGFPISYFVGPLLVPGWVHGIEEGGWLLPEGVFVGLAFFFWKGERVGGETEETEVAPASAERGARSERAYSYWFLSFFLRCLNYV